MKDVLSSFQPGTLGHTVPTACNSHTFPWDHVDTSFDQGSVESSHLFCPIGYPNPIASQFPRDSLLWLWERLVVLLMTNHPVQVRHRHQDGVMTLAFL